MKPSRIWPVVVSVFVVQPFLRSQVEVARIPIEYAGVVVSVEMPKRWVNAPFPVNPVPPDLLAAMLHSRTYSLWTKDWSWNRSWFRGSVGHMVFDAYLRLESPLAALEAGEQANPRRFNFLSPTDMLLYIQAAHSRVNDAEFLEFFLVKHGSTIWVRELRKNAVSNGVPRSETWLLGLTTEIFLRFDFASTRDAEGEAGDRWLAAALYWQNRMIESIQVTGLKQHLTGDEKVTVWKFPDSLKEDPNFTK